MAPASMLVSEINTKQHDVRVTMRVIRKWLVLDPSNKVEHFNLELVLLDSMGNRIGATVRQQLVYIFKKQLEEGEVYTLTKLDVKDNEGDYRSTTHKFKLSFDKLSKVLRQTTSNLPLMAYNFHSPNDVFAKSFDVNYLIDIMGILTGVGEEREFVKNGKKNKRITIELNNAGFSFKVTMFGSFVDDINSLIANGDAINTVIAVLFAKVKNWNDSRNISTTFSSRLFINPDIPDVITLKEKTADVIETPTKGLTQLQEKIKMTEEDEFLNLTPKSTITEMKEFYRKKNANDVSKDPDFVVLATVSAFVDEEKWFYIACSRCTRRATPDSEEWFCAKCDTHIVEVTPKFFLKLRVNDGSTMATFVMFDRDADELLKHSCADLLGYFDMETVSKEMPQEVADLKEKTLLFKIGCDRGSGSRYEPSYVVKRVTANENIIIRFKESGVDKTNSSVEHQAEGIKGNLSDMVAQDLTCKFSETQVEGQQNGKAHEDVVDLESNNDDVPSLKRNNTMGYDSAADKLPKKNIKIEKD